MQILIGADPELFLTVNNKFVNAHGLFPGTKQEPFRVEKGAIQVDGVALEFNIDPARTEEEFLDNIDTVLKQMNEMVREVDKDMRLNFLPVARFDEKEFLEFPDECKILGCDPDYNTSGRVNRQPEELMYEPIRTGSGHIHIGWTDKNDPFAPEHFGDALAISRHFSKNPFDRLNPLEIERLNYYGADGAFRPKPYGVELREFSNVWVEHEESRRKMYQHIMKNMKSLGGVEH